MLICFVVVFLFFSAIVFDLLFVFCCLLRLLVVFVCVLFFGFRVVVFGVVR